ncbi:hypothetical protein O6H91_04G093700 [Diphasiastrum complanatum]|uniref:Uncharacterized protein n=1 Tax=Diphasiastrum complanatum TaxID=34168 RepID=A0ACC2DZ42_DIPCM|nr:hypothetical protein O6H91_04G093700 [Diphasiastrum complanatum]
MNRKILDYAKQLSSLNSFNARRFCKLKQDGQAFVPYQFLWVLCHLGFVQAFATTSKFNHANNKFPKGAFGNAQGGRSTSARRPKITWKKDISQGSYTKRSILPLIRTPAEDLMEQIRLKQWESALKVFDFMKGQDDYQEDVGIYIRLLEMLGHCKQPEAATHLFHKMASDGCKPSTEVYTALLSAYTRSNRLNLALSTFKQMKQQPHCFPNVYTYSLMIKACSDACEFDLVRTFLLEMRSAGIEPNIVTYNSLLDAYGKAGLLDKMENLLLSLIKDDVFKPNVWTQNMILKNYGKWGQVTKMEEWYERLTSLGVEADITTLNTLMNVYGKERMFEKMTAVMEYMKRYHYNLDTISYNIMIDAFGKAGMVQEMHKIFNLMKFEGVRPDSITFCSLINGYGIQGIISKIKKLLQQLKNHDVVPDVAVYNSALNAYRRAKNICEMEKLLLEMSEAGCFPDAVSFNIMIDACRSNGLHNRAEELLLQSQKQGVRRQLQQN